MTGRLIFSHYVWVIYKRYYYNVEDIIIMAENEEELQKI